jgi:hypothetical protein
MLKKLGFKTMALAAGLAVAAPTLSLARDRDDLRGRNSNSHARVENHERYERSDRDNRGIRDRGDRRFNFRSYSTPAPAANGYYDQYGVWHPYGYYDGFGVWHAYGY